MNESTGRVSFDLEAANRGVNDAITLRPLREAISNAAAHIRERTQKDEKPAQQVAR